MCHQLQVARCTNMTFRQIAVAGHPPFTYRELWARDPGTRPAFCGRSGGGLCSCVIESQAVTGFHLACFYIPLMSEVTGSETRSPSHSGSAEREGTFVLSQQNFLLFSLLLSVLMMLIFTLASHTENKPTLASNLQKVVELHSGKHF